MEIRMRDFILALCASSLLMSGCSASAQSERLVRLAEIEIDPMQADAYRAALREEISTSLRIEPGVLALYAVSVKDHPNQIRLFEMYADAAAYRAHLESSLFKRYKSTTAAMVQSLRLIETEPVAIEAKRSF